MKFVEAPVINGVACAKIEHQDVEAEMEYWNYGIICSVLWANPSLGVIEGFVGRIWSQYQVDKVVVARKEVYLV